MSDAVEGVVNRAFRVRSVWAAVGPALLLSRVARGTSLPLRGLLFAVGTSAVVTP